MTDEPKKYTHVGVEPKTRKQIAILATVKGCEMYILTGLWANEAWEEAKQAGLVTDLMLEPQKAHVVGKESIVEFDEADGKKLLKAIKLSPTKKAASRRGMVKA